MRWRLERPKVGGDLKPRREANVRVTSAPPGSATPASSRSSARSDRPRRAADGGSPWRKTGRRQRWRCEDEDLIKRCETGHPPLRVDSQHVLSRAAPLSVDTRGRTRAETPSGSSPQRIRATERIPNFRHDELNRVGCANLVRVDELADLQAKLNAPHTALSLAMA